MNLFIYFNPDIFLAWPANTDAGRLREFSAMEGGDKRGRLENRNPLILEIVFVLLVFLHVLHPCFPTAVSCACFV